MTELLTDLPEALQVNAPITRRISPPANVPELVSAVGSWDVTIATSPGRTVLVSPQLRVPDTDEEWDVTVNFKDTTPHVYAIPVNTTIHTRPIGELTGFQIGDSLNDGTIRFTIGDIRHKTGTDDEVRSWVGFTQDALEIAFAAALASTYALTITKSGAVPWTERVKFTPVGGGDPVLFSVQGTFTSLTQGYVTINMTTEGVYRWDYEYSTDGTTWTSYSNGIIQVTGTGFTAGTDIRIYNRLVKIYEDKLANREDTTGYTIEDRTKHTHCLLYTSPSPRD